MLKPGSDWRLFISADGLKGISTRTLFDEIRAYPRIAIPRKILF